jgi:hypothetical protein
MSRPKKLKIEVRAVNSPSTIHITAKEKHVYVCRNCGNRYYSFYHFCPQCLGIITSLEAARMGVRIVSIPAEKVSQSNSWIGTLSGEKERDLSKALQHLPFILLERSDAGVVQEWKEALEVEEIQSEIFESLPAKKQKAKYSPLFATNAPLPHFLPASLENGVREIARLMRNAAVRLQWVEGVIAGFKIIDLCYKGDPTLRVLFADFLFQIQQRLEQSVEALQGSYKSREEAFVPMIRKMTAEFRRMEKEIENIRRTVRQQL